jgi:large subunit ribosomal protein L1
MAKGKKYTDAAKRFDRDHLHSSTEALELVKQLATAKFDETVELAVRLGVDPRKADQMVRGTVALPSGTGKDVRVAVFAQGEAAAAAREAGADFVGADDLAAEVEGACSTSTSPSRPPTSCRGRQARPGARSPRADAQPQDRHRHHRRRPRRSRSSRAARSSTAPTATATCTCPSARPASTPSAAGQPAGGHRRAERAKPASAKGRYLRKVTVATTMGPGVKLDANRSQARRGVA